jgi:hypothetical protein
VEMTIEIRRPAAERGAPGNEAVAAGKTMKANDSAATKTITRRSEMDPAMLPPALQRRRAAVIVIVTIARNGLVRPEPRSRTTEERNGGEIPLAKTWNDLLIAGETRTKNVIVNTRRLPK